MKKNRLTILISGARAPVALEMARSFHSEGHRVIMVDSLQLTIARWSNSVSKYFIVPSPRFDKKGFLQKLENIIIKEKVDHFIPTCEEAIFVAGHKDQFQCKTWTSDQKTVLSLHNKLQFYESHKNTLPLPKTIAVKEFTDWKNSYQYVFKPIYSRFGTSIIINKKIRSSFFQEKDKLKWIAQERIHGKEICIYSIWDEGVLKAYSAYHPLYRIGKGAGVYFEPVQNDAVLNFVQEKGKELSYTGQLSFDVIIAKNGKPFFIECNPRATSGVHLLHNYLATAFLDSNTIINTSEKEYAIKYAMTVLHLNKMTKKRIRNSQDIIYKSTDTLPFLFQAVSLAEITYLKFKRKTTWLDATTGDIEWNGDEQE